MGDRTADPARRAHRDRLDDDAQSSDVRVDDNPERAFMHRWRSAVFNDRALSQGVRMTLLALAEFADEKGRRACPAAVTLAKIGGSSEKSVRTYLATAERAGWFERAQPSVGRVGKAWASYGYELRIPAGADTRRVTEVIRAERDTAASLRAETVTSPPEPCSGNSGDLVRQIASDGAVTLTADLALDLASDLAQEKPMSNAPRSTADEGSDKGEESTQAITRDAISAFNEILGKPNGLLPTVSSNVGFTTRCKQVKRVIDTSSEICADLTGSPKVTPRFWRAYFEAIALDDFRSGRRKPKEMGEHSTWTPTFEYLTRPSVMVDVYEKARSNTT